MPGTYLPVNYLPVMVIMFIAIAFGLGSLVFGLILRPRRPYPEKLAPYESGNEPIGDTRQRFSIQFYVVAMLFLVFDVEAIFLYPWAVVFDEIGMYAFVEMIIFIIILFVGYVYAWKKGAFNWD